jgi:hypothetical protein
MIGVYAKRAVATFDRSIISRRIKRQAPNPLGKGLAMTRRIARNSIRRVKTDRPAKPGKPPRSRAEGAPMKLIFYSMNRNRLSGVVGFVGFNNKRGGVTVPEAHEHGRSRPVSVLIKRKVKASQRGRDSRGRFTSNKRWRENARRLYQQGRIKSKQPQTVVRRVTFPERPTMGPALDKVLPKLPPMWRNSITG